MGPGGTDTVDCGKRGAAATVAGGATRLEDEERPTEDPLREPRYAEDLLAGVRKLSEPRSDPSPLKEVSPCGQQREVLNCGDLGAYETESSGGCSANASGANAANENGCGDPSPKHTAQHLQYP